MADKLYLVRTKDIDEDGRGAVIKEYINGVFTTREGAEKCREEVAARITVQRHNYETTEDEITVTELDADTFYEDI